MAKVALNNTNSGYNLSVINQNFQTIEDILNDLVLFRDDDSGSPNQMSLPLDMNGQNLFNAENIYANNLILGGVDISEAIVDSVNETLANAITAENAAIAASQTLAQFHLEYLGTRSSDPSPVGITDGALYFNTTTLELKYLRSGVWTSFPQANQVAHTILNRPADFTTGTTNLTLPATSYTKTVLWVMFDGAYQQPGTYSLTTQTNLNFPAGVGSTVQKIDIAYIAPLASAIIDDLSITTAKLGPAAVTQDKLAALSVGSSQLGTGQVITDKLADLGVTTPKIADTAITFPKLASDKNPFLSGLTIPRYVGSVAGLRTLSKLGSPQVITTGYYSFGDGGGATYSLNAGDTTSADNGGTIIVGADGGRWYMVMGGQVDVKQFGADPTGSASCHIPFNAAIATGKRVRISKGSYVATNQISCPFQGQMVQGDGKEVSVVRILSNFNMAAPGVFVFTGSEPGPQLRDFQITFAQPDTTVRANLTSYPPAVYANNVPRFVLERIKIVCAMTAVSMLDNCGGALIVHCEMSAFTNHVWIDGSIDSVRLINNHFWPFGMTSNQQSIYGNINTVGVLSGRMDDLHMDGCIFICGTGFKSFLGSRANAGNTGGNITNCDFDTFSGIAMSDGNIGCSACFFSTIPGYQAIAVTGGNLRVGDSKFLTGGILPSPTVSVSGTNGAIVQISNSQFDTFNFDYTSCNVTGTGNVLMLTNNFFKRTANVAYGQPTIVQGTGGRLTAVANRTGDKGSGGGTFIFITQDDYHNITGNSAPGWAYTAPAHTTMVLANNN